jgi:ketosteroid isomerase-like protein
MAEQGTTETVFAHHLQAVRDRNIEAIVEDYAEDAIIMTPDGIFRGLEQTRMIFTNSINNLPADVLANLQVDRLDIDGEFVYLLWSSGSVIQSATDTLCVRDGKIIMQSMFAVFGS